MRSAAPPQAATALPFSRPLVVDDVPADGLETEIAAEPQECASVATAAGLPAVASLGATFRIDRQSGGRLEVQGEGRARMTQICVVTLEPFESDIAFPIEATFAPRKAEPRQVPTVSRRRDRGGIRRDVPASSTPTPSPAEETDPPDPIVDGRIDLGAIAVEFLTLALDFYPRKPGVQFDDVVAPETADPKQSAFAALERLKDRS